MTCTITTEKYEMGLGAPDDTRIVAVRVDKATNRTAPIG
jgi:hypothetical protein